MLGGRGAELRRRVVEFDGKGEISGSARRRGRTSEPGGGKARRAMINAASKGDSLAQVEEHLVA